MRDPKAIKDQGLTIKDPGAPSPPAACPSLRTHTRRRALVSSPRMPSRFSSRVFPAFAVVVAGMLVLHGSAQTIPTLAIVNVTVIDGTDARPAVANVIVREGLVRRVTTTAPPDGSTVVDGAGKFLIPGLWDMHVHLATRPEPELAEKTMLPMFLSHGIVGVRDMGGPLERLLSLRDRVERGDLNGPRIVTPGPFIKGRGKPDRCSGARRPLQRHPHSWTNSPQPELTSSKSRRVWIRRSMPPSSARRDAGDCRCPVTCRCR